MSYAIHRVSRFSIVGPYTLDIGFADGMTQRIDFLPVLRGTLFGPLKDQALFNAVELDAASGVLTWPNGADFNPATLHDWPEAGPRLAALARGWADGSTAPQPAR
jgi:hypothetical protein